MDKLKILSGNACFLVKNTSDTMSRKDFEGYLKGEGFAEFRKYGWKDRGCFYINVNSMRFSAGVSKPAKLAQTIVGEGIKNPFTIDEFRAIWNILKTHIGDLDQRDEITKGCSLFLVCDEMLNESSNEFIDYFSYNRGTFLHYILPPLQRSTLATLYTEESLKTHIEAILTKYKGKKYTVSYDINSGANIYPQDWYILKHSDESHSKSYGTHYYIPTTKNVQNGLVKEIAEAITQFLTSTSDTSEYSLFYTLPLGNAKYNSSAYDHLSCVVAVK